MDDLVLNPGGEDDGMMFAVGVQNQKGVHLTNFPTPSLVFDHFPPAATAVVAGRKRSSRNQPLALAERF
jgi:hypothetical protein